MSEYTDGYDAMLEEERIAIQACIIDTCTIIFHRLERVSVLAQHATHDLDCRDTIEAHEREHDRRILGQFISDIQLKLCVLETLQSFCEAVASTPSSPPLFLSSGVVRGQEALTLYLASWSLSPFISSGVL